MSENYSISKKNEVRKIKQNIKFIFYLGLEYSENFFSKV